MRRDKIRRLHREHVTSAGKKGIAFILIEHDVERGALIFPDGWEVACSPEQLDERQTLPGYAEALESNAGGADACTLVVAKMTS